MSQLTVGENALANLDLVREKFAVDLQSQNFPSLTVPCTAGDAMGFEFGVVFSVTAAALGTMCPNIALRRDCMEKLAALLISSLTQGDF